MRFVLSAPMTCMSPSNAASIICRDVYQLSHNKYVGCSFVAMYALNQSTTKFYSPFFLSERDGNHMEKLGYRISSSTTRLDVPTRFYLPCERNENLILESDGRLPLFLSKGNSIITLFKYNFFFA